MKAHVYRDPKALLLWRFGTASAEYSAVCAAAARFGLSVRTVGDGDLAAKIGDLCEGLPAPTFSPLPLLPNTAAAIISGLSEKDGSLNGFVEAIHSTGAEIPIKACVTPTSRKWTLLQLVNELLAEHEAVGNPE